MKMVKIPRKAYTLEFKQEAVRLVESASVSRKQPGVWEWWSRRFRTGSGRIGQVSCGARGTRRVTAEQMEIRRLRAELARVTMERDILGKATAFFAKGQK